jgi:hypothetical protein
MKWFSHKNNYIMKSMEPQVPSTDRFDTRKIVPIMKDECTIEWTKYHTYSLANKVTSTTKRWQFVTPGYYIPKAIVPSQLTLIVG